jgi:hypothetical protein
MIKIAIISKIIDNDQIVLNKEGILPPDHIFLDSAPNLGPLISRRELDRCKKLLKRKL